MSGGGSCFTTFPCRFAPAGTPRPAAAAFVAGGLAAPRCANPDMGPQRGVVEVDEAPSEAGIESGELVYSLSSLMPLPPCLLSLPLLVTN